MVHIVGVNSGIVKSGNSAIGDGDGGKIVVERGHGEAKKKWNRVVVTGRKDEACK